MVSALSGLGSSLGGDIVLCSWARHFTLGEFNAVGKRGGGGGELK